MKKASYLFFKKKWRSNKSPSSFTIKESTPECLGGQSDNGKRNPCISLTLKLVNAYAAQIGMALGQTAYLCGAASTLQGR